MSQPACDHGGLLVQKDILLVFKVKPYTNRDGGGGGGGVNLVWSRDLEVQDSSNKKFEIPEISTARQILSDGGNECYVFSPFRKCIGYRGLDLK